MRAGSERAGALRRHGADGSWALDVAIVGAGPAGLAAALFLSGMPPRNGVRAAEARPVGSGLILQPTGLAVLDRLGCAEIEALGRIENWRRRGRRPSRFDVLRGARRS